MKKAYKLTAEIGGFPETYFKKKSTAEKTMKVFDALTVEGKTIPWKLEKIEIMSEADALKQFLSLPDDIEHAVKEREK